MITAADILVIDDEPAVREMLAMGLRRAGFDMREANDEVEARAAILERLPDLILLDWMLPGRPGVELARDLRNAVLTRDTPIIFLTARGEERDRVHGLDVGADDFVSKPFSMAELIARIKAVLRRSASARSEAAVEFVGLRLDPNSHRVTANDEPVELSAMEFRLLHFLMSHPDRVYNRPQLIDQVWGAGAYIGDRTVDVHIRSLRKALSPSGHQHMVQTVRGAGYRFSEHP